MFLYLEQRIMQDLCNAVFNILVMILHQDLALCTYFFFFLCATPSYVNVIKHSFCMCKDRSEEFVHFCTFTSIVCGIIRQNFMNAFSNISYIEERFFSFIGKHVK